MQNGIGTMSFRTILGFIIALPLFQISFAFAAGKAPTPPESSPSPSPSPTQSVVAASISSVQAPKPSSAPAAEPSLKSTREQPRSTSGLPPALVEVETKYTQHPTISAQFTQIDHNQTMGKRKTSSGKILVKRPGKIRWETESPDPNLLVSNGKIFWFYTPPFDESEPGQLIERKASEVQSQVATTLLSGDFSKIKGIKVNQKSDSTFEIIPKPGTAGTVLKATLTLDLSQHLIQKVSLFHKGGNQAEITLSQIELGKTLADDLFVFKAPPNTDLVR